MSDAASLAIGSVFGAISFIDPLSGVAIIAMNLLFNLVMFDPRLLMRSKLMSIDYKLRSTNNFDYVNNGSIATKQH